MGSQQKKKKRTKDVRSTTSEIKRTQDLDANKLALQPSFEIGYSPTGVGTIDFVNISESINASQTNAPTAPAQITGLNVTPFSPSQLNLTWTASGAPGFAYYNIYRSTTTGTEVIFTTTTTNSYSDSGLDVGVTYFYKIAAVNSLGMIGIQSVEDSAQTPGVLSFRLQLNNDYSDSALFGVPTSTGGRVAVGNVAFATPGKFGSHFAQLNVPNVPDPAVPDIINGIDNPNIQGNYSVGYSISMWIYPTDISALSRQRYIAFKWDTTTPSINVQRLFITSAGIVVFRPAINGVSVGAEKTGWIINSWQHLAVTYNAVTNTPLVYRNGVVGTSSVITDTVPNSFINYHLYIGVDPQDQSNTYYRGRADEVQFFKGIVLTPTQVTNLMNTNSV
jgi:hypothetical protein